MPNNSRAFLMSRRSVGMRVGGLVTYGRVLKSMLKMVMFACVYVRVYVYVCMYVCLWIFTLYV